MDPVLIVVILVVIGCYLGSCWVYPWASCRHCERGKVRSPKGNAWRDCRHCGGKGKRHRAGARMLGK